MVLNGAFPDLSLSTNRLTGRSRLTRKRALNTGLEEVNSHRLGKYDVLCISRYRHMLGDDKSAPTCAASNGLRPCSCQRPPAEASPHAELRPESMDGSPKTGGDGMRIWGLYQQTMGFNCFNMIYNQI
jgi:hypothetical protein